MLEYIDWKESYYYRQMIVRHAVDDQKWDNIAYLRDEEAELMIKMIRGYRFKKPSFKLDELLRLLPSFTKKCYNSIEMVYKEVLTETYWKKEYD